MELLSNYADTFTQTRCDQLIMDVPPVEELPFYDEEQYDTLTEQEKRDRANAFRKYRENLQNAGSDSE